YFAIALILNLQNLIFNIIIFASSPIVLVTMFWDGKFYFQSIRGNGGMAKRWWQLTERITLHIPIVSGGIFFALSGAQKFVNLNEGYMPLVYASIMILLPYFILDERWKSKYHWPDGIILLFLITAAVTAAAIFMMNTGKTL
ncbi:MAG: hypothetical protein MUC95_05810, partial [Spirochaetes bacterium]|nr:hypothetical protein [Spirochaetota bacterium]